MVPYIRNLSQLTKSKLSKIWVGDPGSGKNYPGSGSMGKKTPDSGSGSATLLPRIQGTSRFYLLCLCCR